MNIQYFTSKENFLFSTLMSRFLSLRFYSTLRMRNQYDSCTPRMRNQYDSCIPRMRNQYDSCIPRMRNPYYNQGACFESGLTALVSPFVLLASYEVIT